MALQIRRGTNAERTLITPLPGELIYVTDYLTAPPGTNAVYVGDGSTSGGIPVAVTPVLAGTLAGNVNLGGNEINGTGSISITGNISNSGTLTVTGNIVGVGNISRTGNLTLTGDATVSGTIAAATFEGDFLGSLFADDSSGPLVNAITNTFNGAGITLTSSTATTVIDGSSLSFEDTSDPLIPFTIGSDDVPVGILVKANKGLTFEAQQGTVEGLDSAGTLIFQLYRGTAAIKEDVQAGDILAGMSALAYNSGLYKFAGTYGFTIENPAGAPPGTAPSTFIVGSASALDDFGNGIFAAAEGALRFTSEGILKVPVMRVGSFDNTGEGDISPEIGMIIFNTQTGKFRGYVNDTGLAGGGSSNGIPGWVDLN